MRVIGRRVDEDRPPDIKGLEVKMIPLALLTTAARASNFLVIVADDLGASKVEGFADPASTSFYLPETPTLDALRGAGVSFTNAWADPVCSPTRAALHSGFPGARTGIGDVLRDASPGLDDGSWVTLAELAHAAGYQTGAFGKWHIGTEGSGGTLDWELAETDPPITLNERPHPVGAGFRTYVGDLDGVMAAYDGWTRVSYPGVGGTGTADLAWSTDNVDDVVTEEATSWISDQDDDWFAMVNYYSPHSQMANGVYTLDALDASCPGDARLVDGNVTDENGDGRTNDDSEMLVYLSLVECMDARLATLLGGIDPTVLADTTIVFMGDNGTPGRVLEGEYADAGPRTENGKGSVYETGVRVPMILTDGETWQDLMAGNPLTSDVYPTPGVEFTTPIHTMDLHDTLLGAMGIDSDRFGTGTSRDASRWIASGTEPTITFPAGIYTEFFNDDWDTGIGGLDDAAAAAYRSGSWKLVVNADDGGSCVTLELYDLATDPYERTDVAADNEPTVTSLYAVVQAFGIAWLPTTTC